MDQLNNVGRAVTLSRRGTLAAVTGLLATGDAGVARGQQPPVQAAPPAPRAAAPAVGVLETVAELPIRPALVTVDRVDRVFSTVHWFDRAEPMLIEITGRDSFRPWPNQDWNAGFGSGPEAFDQPLGILVDGENRVWTIDCGVFPTLTDGRPPLENRSPRLLAFEAASGRTAFSLSLPTDSCPPGTYPQDLAVDDRRGFAYLADIGGVRRPAIITVDLNSRRVRRFEAHASLGPEEVDLMVEGRRLVFPDGRGGFQPARIGINPITLSADGETLFYGPMCGLGWYAVPARLFREGAPDSAVAAAIRRIANKPVCDGVATDADGNHFLTNLGENAIDRIDADGVLTRLVQDDRLIWTDGVRFGRDSWLYASVNQLNRSPLFSGGEDRGVAPYTILRVNTGTPGLVGR